MYVQSNGKLAFLAHPRTASRAMAETLKKRGFLMQGGHHHGPPDHQLGPRTAFCVVRNHWDAMASWYKHFSNKATQPLSGKWINQFVGGHPNYFKPDRLWWFTYLDPQPIILRYENLQEDLDALLPRFDIEPIQLEVVGVSHNPEQKHYRDFYRDEDAVTRVRKLWGPEIDRLGYTY